MLIKFVKDQEDEKAKLYLLFIVTTLDAIGRKKYHLKFLPLISESLSRNCYKYRNGIQKWISGKCRRT